MKNTIISILVLLTFASCSKDTSVDTRPYVVKDSALIDGKMYPTLKVGNLEWMTENYISGARVLTFYDRLDSLPEGWRMPIIQDFVGIHEYLGAPSETLDSLSRGLSCDIDPIFGSMLSERSEKYQTTDDIGFSKVLLEYNDYVAFWVILVRNPGKEGYKFAIDDISFESYAHGGMNYNFYTGEHSADFGDVILVRDLD